MGEQHPRRPHDQDNDTSIPDADTARLDVEKERNRLAMEKDLAGKAQAQAAREVTQHQRTAREQAVRQEAERVATEQQRMRERNQQPTRADHDADQATPETGMIGTPHDQEMANKDAEIHRLRAEVAQLQATSPSEKPALGAMSLSDLYDHLSVFDKPVTAFSKEARQKELTNVVQGVREAIQSQAPDYQEMACRLVMAPGLTMTVKE